MHEMVGVRNLGNSPAVSDSDLKVVTGSSLPDSTLVPPDDSRFFVAAKRLVDIALATILIVLSTPAMLIVAFLVWLDDHGPILNYQPMVGRKGKEFRLYSFRTLHLQGARSIGQPSGAKGSQFKVLDDQSTTSVGGWLRRFSIDELPQLFCVLTGTMSIVGPRPQSSIEAGVHAPEQKILQSVKPGIVCLREIRNRSKLSFGEWSDSDIEYVMNRSPWLDMRIFALAWPAVLLCRRRG
jgi:lipopolysaccharide/colanic/teichoic acid biosynthesis glycosyltransferase